MKYKVKTRLTTMVLLALMAFGTVSASEAVSEKIILSGRQWPDFSDQENPADGSVMVLVL